MLKPKLKGIKNKPKYSTIGDFTQWVFEQIWEWPKKLILVKNLQFLFYPYETWSK